MKSRGILTGLIVVLTLSVCGCEKATPKELREAAENNFKRQVLKKGPLEVVRSVGRPKEKWRRDIHNFYYKYYINENKDTGKALAATVVFRNKQVESVRFKQVQLAVAK
ncbi:MAG: hypothetical protein ACYTGQ_01910 [Planctomycetota bacterium]|jgi:hypothetical protein